MFIISLNTNFLKENKDDSLQSLEIESSTSVYLDCSAFIDCDPFNGFKFSNCKNIEGYYVYFDCEKCECIAEQVMIFPSTPSTIPISFPTPTPTPTIMPELDPPTHNNFFVKIIMMILKFFRFDYKNH